jgi:hypothetical protein
MSSPQPIGSFREWLFDRLLGSRFATMAIDDSDIDKTAKRLGVDPELLLEVRAQARVDRRARGLPSPKLRHSKPEPGAAVRRLYQYQISLPAEIEAAWRDECAFREVRGALLLRSLIHDYLSNSREPEFMSFWLLGGKCYIAGKHKRHLHEEKATIPNGAKRALSRRAVLAGTTPTTIVRSLMLEVLAGQHRHVRLVESSMMFDDERRYLAPSGHT